MRARTFILALTGVCVSVSSISAWAQADKLADAVGGVEKKSVGTISESPPPRFRGIDEAAFTVSHVKDYRGSNFGLVPGPGKPLVDVLHHQFVGTLRVDRKIDFMRVDVRYFDAEGVQIHTCSDQRYGTIDANEEVYFLVKCYFVPLETEKRLSKYTIEVTSKVAAQSPSATEVLVPAAEPAIGTASAPSDKEKRPRFTFRKARVEGSNPSSFNGTVEVDRQVDYITVYMDIYDKRGVFLYQCASQIHNGIVPKKEMAFFMNCDDLPSELESRVHHFTIEAY